jgi:hypothetical protein
MTNDLEVLLSRFRRHNPCAKSVTVRLESICIGGEMNCLTGIAGFFTTHELGARRTPNGLEISADDLARAVEIYDQLAE